MCLVRKAWMTVNTVFVLHFLQKLVVIFRLAEKLVVPSSFNSLIQAAEPHFS